MRIRTRGLNDRLAVLQKGSTEKGSRLSFRYNDKHGSVNIICIITNVYNETIYADCIDEVVQEFPEVPGILGLLDHKEHKKESFWPFNKKREFNSMPDLFKINSWVPGQVIIEPYNNGYKIVSSNTSLPILFTTSSQEHLLDLEDL